jgi:DNA-binding protein HU-beta
MNKGELVDAIAAKTKGLATKKVVDAVVSELLNVIIDTVVSGDRVTLVGFGSFEARTRKEREGHNPRTGERMIIPSVTVPCFSAGKLFKEKAN